MARARGRARARRRRRPRRERDELLRLALDLHRPARASRPQTMADPHALHVPCDPELRRMRPLLSSIVPVGIPDNELTGRDGRQRARGEHQAAAGLDPAPRDRARRPSLIVVEDAHWLDSNSWALLLEIVQSVPRVAVRRHRAADERRRPSSTRACARWGRPSHRAGAAERRRDPHARRAARSASQRCRRAHRVRRRPRRRPPLLLRAARPDAARGRPRRGATATAVVADLDSLDLPATIEGAVLSRIDRLNAGPAAVPEGRRRHRPLVPLAHGRRHTAGHRAARRGAGPPRDARRPWT